MRVNICKAFKTVPETYCYISISHYPTIVYASFIGIAFFFNFFMLR